MLVISVSITNLPTWGSSDVGLCSVYCRP